MAWLPPELEIGEEPELRPPEFEPELVEPEPEELEPVELEPEELEPEELEPVEPEPEELEPEELEPVEPEPVADEPEPAEGEPDEPVLDALVLCADPGRARASAPAVTTLAMVTAVVADRTLFLPRSLAATAWRIPSSRRALLMYPILRAPTRESLYEPSR